MVTTKKKSVRLTPGLKHIAANWKTLLAEYNKPIPEYKTEKCGNCGGDGYNYDCHGRYYICGACRGSGNTGPSQMDASMDRHMEFRRRAMELVMEAIKLDSVKKKRKSLTLNK